MRIDLSSDDSFFLPGKALTTGRDDPDAPQFSDLLKDLAEDPLAEGLPVSLENAENTETGSEQTLKLYVAVDPDLLEFVGIKADPAGETPPVTAEELVELIADSGPKEPQASAEVPVTHTAPQDKPASGPITGPVAPDPPPLTQEPEAGPPPASPAPSSPPQSHKVLVPGEPEVLIHQDNEPNSKSKKTENSPKQEATQTETLRQDLPNQSESVNMALLPDLTAAYKDPALETSTEDAPEKKPAQTTLSLNEAETATEYQETDLSYEEIQALVETALDRGKHLPARVHQLLKELLGALVEGKRWLLDQHRLIGLEAKEWHLLTQLFPPHFYGGLLRQQVHSELPLFEILQDLSAQRPPSPERQQQLQALWQPGFGSKSLPRLLQHWIQDQAPESSPEELAQLLEHWQQQQTLPPGPIGRTLQLALAYRHHPEKMHNLFELSRSLLHGRILTLDQRNLLAQCVSERCFHRELTNQSQIQDLLARTLNGQEPTENELRQLLGGCSQGVLSYLPAPQLPASLQELQDYVRHDLLGHEEGLLDLIAEANGWHQAELV